MFFWFSDIQFNVTLYGLSLISYGFNLTKCGINLISSELLHNESLKWNSSLLDILLLYFPF